MRGPDPWGAGRAWLQPVATGRKSARPKNASNMPKLLPSVATACRVERMVRRGSMVRVRQRALQKAPQSGAFLVGATCVVPMCGTCGARYGAFKSTWRFDDRETGRAATTTSKIELWSSVESGPAALQRPGPGTGKDLPMQRKRTPGDLLEHPLVVVFPLRTVFRCSTRSAGRADSRSDSARPVQHSSSH